MSYFPNGIRLGLDGHIVEAEVASHRCSSLMGHGFDFRMTFPNPWSFLHSHLLLSPSSHCASFLPCSLPLSLSLIMKERNVTHIMIYLQRYKERNHSTCSLSHALSCHCALQVVPNYTAYVNDWGWDHIIQVVWDFHSLLQEKNKGTTNTSVW